MGGGKISQQCKFTDIIFPLSSPKTRAGKENVLFHHKAQQQCPLDFAHVLRKKEMFSRQMICAGRPFPSSFVISEWFFGRFRKHVRNAWHNSLRILKFSRFIIDTLINSLVNSLERISSTKSLTALTPSGKNSLCYLKNPALNVWSEAVWNHFGLQFHTITFLNRLCWRVCAPSCPTISGWLVTWTRHLQLWTWAAPLLPPSFLCQSSETWNQKVSHLLK